MTHWVWDGNQPLHEWTELELSGHNKQDVITWLFEPDSFAPLAKLQGEQRQSIVSDHLGTPLQMYGARGDLSWAAELDSYGAVRKQRGEVGACPFRYQGQYKDQETGLYYNRFRYYDPHAGQYVSQDPIGLCGGMPNMYAYVYDTNLLIDTIGLTGLDVGGYSVYGLYDLGAKDPYYIGISNDPLRRQFEHMDTGRLSDSGELRVLDENLKYREARCVEQMKIENHNTKTGIIGEKISAENRGNKVNSFDKNRTDTRGKAFKAEYEKAKKKTKIKCPK